MIDALVAADKFTRVDEGVRALPFDDYPQQVRERINQDIVSARAEVSLLHRRAALEARRDQVVRLYWARVTSAADISTRLGVASRAIEGDLTVLRRLGRIR